MPGDGEGAVPATIDNFDAAMASTDMGEGAPEGQPQGLGSDMSLGLGSMFDEPVQTDPATGRELDGMPGLPDGTEEDGEGGEEVDPMEALAEDGEDGLDEGDEAVDADAKLLEQVKLDEVVPEELLDRLMVKQKINGEEHEVSLREATENGQRLVDYSRSKRELAAQRAEHGKAVDAFTGLIESWKADSPDGRISTRRTLERLQVPIMEIAKDIANEYVTLQNMTPGERENFEARRRAEDEAWEAKQRAQQLEAQMQQSRQQEDVSGLKQKVEKWRDKALKAAGLRADSDHIRKTFATHLGALWNREQDTLQQAVKEAADATKQDWAETVEAYNAESASKSRAKRGRGIPAKGAARGGGARKTAPSKIAPTIDNFDDFIAGR